MKTYLKGITAVAAMFTVSFSLASAHMMGAPAEETGTTAPVLTHEQEVAQGLALYQKIQSKQMSCTDATDADFELMGEYFMGQNMTMADHDTMNDRLVAMMGHDGEEAIHMNIGKHGSNCDTAVAAANGKADGTANPMMNPTGATGGQNEWLEHFSIYNIILYIFALFGFVSIMKTVADIQKKPKIKQ